MTKIEKIIDILMDIGYKILCFLCAIIVAVACVSSCSFSVYAFSPNNPAEWASMIEQIKEDAERRSVEVFQTLNQDLVNGNLDGSTELGKKKIKTFLLQELYRQCNSIKLIEHAAELALQTVPDYSGIDNLNDTYAAVASGCSGIYTSYKDGHQHVANAFGLLDNGVFVESDEFAVSFRTVRLYYGGHYFPVGVGVGGFIYETVFDPYNRGTTFEIYSSGGYFNTNATFTFVNVRDGKYANFDGSSTTPLPASLLSQYSRNNFVSFGGLQVNEALPEGDINTDDIMNYYNNVLLPYILNNYYFDGIENYLFFPDGYGTNNFYFPHSGISIDIDNNYNYNIQIEYQTVTDESGEPVTDESGETQTETIIVTDTRPTDAVYNFTMPTLPHLNEYTDTPPPVNLSDYSDGINFIFACTTGIFNDTGFLPVVVICLSLGVFCYIIWRVGG